MIKWQRQSILDVYKLVLGAFLFLAPWLFGFVYRPARLDTWIASILLMAVSIAALTMFADWEEWVMVILGLWLAGSPWILAFPYGAAMKIAIAVGLLVAYLAALELWLIHYHLPRDRPPSWGADT